MTKPTGTELSKLEALQWNIRLNNLSMKLAAVSKEASS